MPASPVGNTPTPISVLVVDDQRLFVDAMRIPLGSAGFEIVGEIPCCDDVERAVEELRPRLVLFDVYSTDGRGVATARQIVERWPDVVVVAMSGEPHGAMAREVLRAGLHGYLTKEVRLGDFVDGLRAALEGNVVLPRETAGAAAGQLTPEQASAELLVSQLTSRERQVLELLVQGCAGPEIAELLSITPNTVRTHVQNILTKLQVRSRLEAVAFAVRHAVVGERVIRSP